MSREFGQPVVIDNKPCAGGVLGSEAVAKSPADGYTMIVGNAGSHGINAAIYSKLNYDVVQDFSAVGLICTTPNVMVVGPGVQAKTVAWFGVLAPAGTPRPLLNGSMPRPIRHWRSQRSRCAWPPWAAIRRLAPPRALRAASRVT